MYCKKCHYFGHDYLQACPKCNASWEEARKSLGLAWIQGPGFTWFSLDSPTAPLDSELLDVDHILTPPPPEPETHPTATAPADLIDIDSLPSFTSTPATAAGQESPTAAASTVPTPLASVEPLPEIEVDLPLIEVPSPEVPSPAAQKTPLDPLEEITPEEDFLHRLSADMPASDHIILDLPSPEPEKAVEADLVLELEEEDDTPSPQATEDTRGPKQPEALSSPSSPRDELFIPELEELLGPPAPPTASAPSPQPAPAAAETSSPEDFAIILIDDEKTPSSS